MTGSNSILTHFPKGICCLALVKRALAKEINHIQCTFEWKKRLSPHQHIYNWKLYPYGHTQSIIPRTEQIKEIHTRKYYNYRIQMSLLQGRKGPKRK